MKSKPKLELLKAQIHLSHHCNLKCAFCDVPKRNKNKKDLKEEWWIKRVKELSQLNPKIVTISGGGEPLLRPNLLLKVIEILKNSNIRVGIITNGTLISDKIAKGIVKNCDDFRVSIHGTDLETDKLLRGKMSSIKKSIKGIKKIKKFKDEIKKDWPKIDIAMVLTRYNINQISEMIKKGAKLGVDLITLRMVNESFRDKKFHPFKKQMKVFRDNLKGYKKLAKRCKIDLRHDFYIEDLFSQNRNESNSTKTNKTNKKVPFCLIPFHELVIFADGRISPCCNFITKNTKSMIIDSTKNNRIKLRDIWNSKKFNKFREMLIKRSEDLPKTCKECTPDFESLDKEYKENFKDNIS